MNLGNGIEINFEQLDDEQLKSAAAEVFEEVEARNLEVSTGLGSLAAQGMFLSEWRHRDVSQDVVEASVRRFAEIAPERRARAANAIQVLSEKFGRDESEFKVISAKMSNPIYYVTLVSERGIDLGDPENSGKEDPKRSWESVTSDDEETKQKFTIELGGSSIDTRDYVNTESLEALARSGDYYIDEKIPVLNPPFNNYGDSTYAEVVHIKDRRAALSGMQKILGRPNFRFRPFVKI